MLEMGFPIPLKEGEKRRALLPCDVASVPLPKRLIFETGYGECLGIDDSAYRAAGATVGPRDRVCECPMICSPKPVLTDGYFRPNNLLFGWIHAVQGRRITNLLLENRMTAVAWEDMFEGGRQTFWRNNELAGEAAVMHCDAPDRSGSLRVGCRGDRVRELRVAQIRMLERLGCRVAVYYRETSHLLRAEIGRFDIVVNAVLWDVFRTDHLVYEDDLPRMKPGSLIIDISCDEGMAIESSRPTTIADPVYAHKGVLHYAVDHAPALLFRSASESISKAVAPHLPSLLDGRSNEVLQKATIIREGKILDDRISRFQKRENAAVSGQATKRPAC